MQEKSTIVFKGQSNQEYKFEMFPLSTVFKVGDGAIFLVTKRSKNKGKQTKIFIGETEDLERYFNPLCKFTFSEQYGADCICCHYEQDPDIRAEKLQDLRQTNTTVYKNYPKANECVKQNRRSGSDILWVISDTAVAA